MKRSEKLLEYDDKFQSVLTAIFPNRENHLQHFYFMRHFLSSSLSRYLQKFACETILVELAIHEFVQNNDNNSDNDANSLRLVSQKKNKKINFNHQKTICRLDENIGKPLMQQIYKWFQSFSWFLIILELQV